MPRYTTAPSSDYDIWAEDQRTMQVISDDDPVDTGLIDRRGRVIYRVREPAGFDLTRRKSAQPRK